VRHWKFWSLISKIRKSRRKTTGF